VLPSTCACRVALVAVRVGAVDASWRRKMALPASRGAFLIPRRRSLERGAGRVLEIISVCRTGWDVASLALACSSRSPIPTRETESLRSGPMRSRIVFARTSRPGARDWRQSVGWASPAQRVSSVGCALVCGVLLGAKLLGRTRSRGPHRCDGCDHRRPRGDPDCASAETLRPAIHRLPALPVGARAQAAGRAPGAARSPA
jgi:hypothetical protein